MVASNLPTAKDQLTLFQNKEASPVEIANLALAALDENSDLNFIRVPDRDEILKQARRSEERWFKRDPLGLLDGVLSTAKDNCLVRDWTSNWGSTLRSKMGEEDSPAVARLREAGSIILGITTMPELGWKGVCDNALTGSTLNPWNRSRTSGGSSGGAAVTAALGIAPLNIGTDGAGSIRIPASFCGVVGFKPTFGVVPAFPVGALPQFTHIGPITRTVADAILMFEVVAQPDNRDWQALPFKLPPSPRRQHLKVAYSRTLGYAKPDEDVIRVVDEAISRLRGQGWEIDEIDPGFDEPIEILRPLYYAAFANMVAGMGPFAKEIVDAGLIEEINALGSVNGDQIIAALSRRDGLGRHMNIFHESYDLLITPTMPSVALEAGLIVPEGSGMKSWLEWNPYTYPFNLTQQPAASIPCGLSRGLPVGMQVVGRRHRDAFVLEACELIERDIAALRSDARLPR